MILCEKTVGTIPHCSDFRHGWRRKRSPHAGLSQTSRVAKSQPFRQKIFLLFLKLRIPVKLWSKILLDRNLHFHFFVALPTTHLAWYRTFPAYVLRHVNRAALLLLLLLYDKLIDWPWWPVCFSSLHSWSLRHRYVNHRFDASNAKKELQFLRINDVHRWQLHWTTAYIFRYAQAFVPRLSFTPRLATFGLDACRQNAKKEKIKRNRENMRKFKTGGRKGTSRRKLLKKAQSSKARQEESEFIAKCFTTVPAPLDNVKE